MQDHICPNLSLHIEREKERERPSLESGDLAELREEQRVSFGLGYSEIREALFLIQYYFQVDGHYVKNKLKLVLLPFLHRGHWTRITEAVAGRLSYEPPTNDINAPDLYIPVMAFATYIVLAGIASGLSGKFCPEAVNWQFVKGTMGWLLQVMLLKVSLFSLGGGEAPLLDTIAYAGYTFTGMCLAVLGRITLNHTCYLIIVWTCLCAGIFLVKTLKPTLYTHELRSYSS
ncbi:hypothetical protein L484_007436 [Morus notabilis]|uniref:Uncharacterized protein n=2 Tax=Morus notabilis TaxID=981085 RepID=W9QZD5_9ROSA|nr:hypothetical protein L484_007436 [Morus notabilis]